MLRNQGNLKWTSSILLFLSALLFSFALLFDIHPMQASSISILDNYNTAYGGSASMTILNGNPIISYYDGQKQDLRLAVCGNPACSPGTTFTTLIDATGDSGAHSAIAVIDSNPIIAYEDSTYGSLKVAACSDPICNTAPLISTIDPNTGNNNDPSIAVIDDKAVISYREGTDSLKFAACNDSQCTSAQITTLDTDLIGVYSSIVILDGKPVISYEKYTTSGTLRVASCLDATCSVPPIISVVDTNGNVGYSNSMAIINGNPIISYVNGDTGDLKVAACVDPTCSNPAVITRLDMAQPAEGKTAIINMDGKAVIAYGSRAPNDNIMLRSASCDDELCTSASISILDNTTYNAGDYPSIAELNGYPVISYNDEALIKVKVYYGGDDYAASLATPTQPPQSAPVEGFQTIPMPQMTWGRVDWATGYEIQIDDNMNFRSPINTDDDIPPDVLEYSPPIMLPNGVYYWRVCAKINATTCGSWSIPEKFTVSSAS